MGWFEELEKKRLEFSARYEKGELGDDYDKALEKFWATEHEAAKPGGGWFDDLCTRLLDFSLMDYRGEFAGAYDKAAEKFWAIEREANKLSAVHRASFLQDNREALERIVNGLYRTPNRKGKGFGYVEECRLWTEEQGLWHLGWVEWEKAAKERGFKPFMLWDRSTWRRKRKEAKGVTTKDG